MKSYKTIQFSENAFDQWRLGKSGGSMGFTKAGSPVFQFENKAQYEKYLQLNSERSVRA
ncbi:hypothetical protein SJY89_20255 [Bacillus velezensis]|uniref:hypothetical protein n=1 Tax=Bacillus TaxID=1386 RepID=UPI000AD714A3|nr:MULTISPECIES: hypothetical protein [Bacillus]HEO2443821.1 hypothetical protein [Streptococcus agalactiae]MCW5196271.1 hypothetical protein [Bacillus amyloliquefaciens]MDU0078288.1 hypothetical protein [Bacillus sp. IG2]MDU0103960.1 hypothetical protein [Bacillus sp. IS1]MDX7897506.1 hypothetical protein [Bacillus velezensis]